MVKWKTASFWVMLAIALQNIQQIPVVCQLNKKHSKYNSMIPFKIINYLPAKIR
jgi:hypothetical protein